MSDCQIFANQLLVRSTQEYRSLVKNFGGSHGSILAVGLMNDEEYVLSGWIGVNPES